MSERPDELWNGGPWEQPSPPLVPPCPKLPRRRPPVLQPKCRKHRRGLFLFLAFFLLIVVLTVGTVAARYLLPQFSEYPTEESQSTPSSASFSALERAETGTGVTVSISDREGDTMTARDIYKKCVPSVVSLQANGDTGYSTGTGIVMSADGYLLTNAHVVADSHSVQVAFTDGSVLDAKLVGADAGEDIAVLKVDASGLTPAEFGDSDQLQCGDMVVAIGDPLGYRTSITQGIVSALNRSVTVDGVRLQVIQTSAPINFGNSGGALINDRGQVVGITTMKVVSKDNTVEGLGFAIPMVKVKEVADWLIAGQPAFGFTVDYSQGNLRIAEIESNSNAYAAGIRVDDLILALNGSPIQDIQAMKQAKLALTPGQTVSLQIQRGEVTETYTFALQSESDFPDRS